MKVDAIIGITEGIREQQREEYSEQCWSKVAIAAVRFYLTSALLGGQSFRACSIVSMKLSRRPGITTVLMRGRPDCLDR